MRKITNAKVFLPNSSGHFLLLRRNFEGARPGEWDLPGGVVDRGEDPLQAAVRETYEETGLSIGHMALKSVFVDKRFELVSEYTSAGESTGVRSVAAVKRHYYKSEPLDEFYPDIQLSHEHVALGWVALHRLSEHLTTASQQEALEHLMQLEQAAAPEVA